MGTYNVMRKGADHTLHPLDVSEISDASQRLITAQSMTSKLQTLAEPNTALESYGLESIETVLGIDNLSRYGIEGIVQRITDGIRRLWQYLVDKIRQVIAWIRGKSEEEKEAEFKAAARQKYRDFVDSYRHEYADVGVERHVPPPNIAMPIRAFKADASKILTDNLSILPTLTKRLMDIALFGDEEIDPLLTKWDDGKLTVLAGFRDNRLFANFYDLLSAPDDHNTLSEQLARALDNKVKAQSLLYALRYNRTAMEALSAVFPRNRKDFERALSRGDTLTVASGDDLFHFDVTFPDPSTLISAPALVTFSSSSSHSDDKAGILLTTLTITAEDDSMLDEAFSRSKDVKAWRKEHLETQGYNLLEDRVSTLQSTYEQMAKFNRGKTPTENIARHIEGLREDTYNASLTLEELNRQHDAYLAGISSYTLSLYGALSGTTQRSLLSLLTLTNSATRLLSRANTLALEV